MQSPTIAERNEGYIPPLFDQTGGRLGETPILWEMRMAYEWQSDRENDEGWRGWDQCCTLWHFAVSEAEARRTVWERFKHDGSVMPNEIASCFPKRFRNAEDDRLDEKWTAKATETRSAETEGFGPKDDGAAPKGFAQKEAP